MKSILFTSLLFFNSLAIAPRIGESSVSKTGIVVKIIDGDTFDLLTAEKNTVRVRMSGIDCPERKQEFYKVAKDALARYIFKKHVSLVITGRDRNKRTIAVVFCNKKNINLVMIQSGFAWHYKKYSDDTRFAKAEKLARIAKRGLWKMNKPVAPWEFRKNRN